MIGIWSQKPPLTRATLHKAAAFSVHIFTASGAAMRAAGFDGGRRRRLDGDVRLARGCSVIDGIDGTFARRLHVAELLPRWSGDLLDFVVDFTTYVFVPAYAMVASGLLPPSLALALGLIVTVTGALYFADRRMKTSDSYFRGFPALWNVVAFYLFVLKPAPWAAAGAIVALAAATFAPIHFVHPVRVPQWRQLNMAALVLWALLSVFALAEKLEPPSWVTGGTCRDCPLFRNRRADAPRRLMPCADVDDYL